MTSPTIPGSAQQDLEGRSVRDVVETSPGLVDDAWCRKIWRKILQSLDLQYAMQMPHRAITPDTVVFHANGEPLLISDDIDAAPAPEAHLVEDLAALARVIHFAITHELAPAGPLTGRVEGYSAALLATVDACMQADPAQRPASIDAVSALLGMVAPGPLAGAVSLSEAGKRAERDLAATTVAAASSAAPPAASPLPPAAPVQQHAAQQLPAAVPVQQHAAQEAGKRPGRRWAIAAGAGVIAIALALVFLPRLHDGGPVSPSAQTGNGSRASLPAAGSAGSLAAVDPLARKPQADQPAVAVSGDQAVSGPGDVPRGTADNRESGLAARPSSDLTDSPALGASSAATTRASDDVDQLGNMAGKPDPVRPTDRLAATTPATGKPGTPSRAMAGKANYQLQIKPWGTVYVDGVDRGVSPPIKTLSLTPGRHTVRITHPNYRDSILEFESAQSTSNGKIIVDFTRETQ